MGKKIQNNFNGTEGKAEFTKTALQSFSARLRFSPDLTYIMPAQYAFAHKLDEPFEFNNKKYHTINSFLLLGIDTDGDCVDVKVVPASNLSRMFFTEPEVDAVEKDGHIRGASKMQPASNIAEIVHTEGTGRYTGKAVAYKVTIQKVYTPSMTGNATDGYDFTEKDGKLVLEGKDVAVFEDVLVPKDAKYEASIPAELKEFMR